MEAGDDVDIWSYRYYGEQTYVVKFAGFYCRGVGGLEEALYCARRRNMMGPSDPANAIKVYEQG